MRDFLYRSRGAALVTLLALAVALSPTGCDDEPARLTFVLSAPATVVAGEPTTVTVEAHRNGRRDTNFAGAVRLTSTDEAAVLPAAFSFLAIDAGVASLTIDLRTAGTQTLVADSIGSPSRRAATPIVVVAGKGSTFRFLGFSGNAVAGVAETVALEAQDAFGNRAATFVGEIALATSDARATLPADVAFAAGHAGRLVLGASVVFETAGAQSIEAVAVADALVRGEETGILVAAATASGFAVRLLPVAPRVDELTSMVVEAVDPFGNVAETYTGAVRLATDAPLADLPAGVAFRPEQRGSVALPLALRFGSAGSWAIEVMQEGGALTGSSAAVVVTDGPRGEVSGASFDQTIHGGVLDGPDEAGAGLGSAVAAAGDVDGDGVGDWLVSAPGATVDGLTEAGAVWLVFGAPGARLAQRGRSLAGLVAAGEAVKIVGEQAGQRIGEAIAAAGDVNGDGYDDIALGIPSGVGSVRSAGSVVVGFGGPAWRVREGTAVTIGELIGTAGVRIEGVSPGRVRFGASVAGVGDIDGDGTDDLLIGVPGHDEAFNTDIGAAVLVAGRAGLAAVDAIVVGDGTTDGLLIIGAQAGEAAGSCVAAAGDVNGDGRLDLLIGQPGATVKGLGGAGAATVLYSDWDGRPWRIELIALVVSGGVRLEGDAAGGRFGAAVAGVPDVDGDGRAEVLVGSPGASPGGRLGAGEVVLVPGAVLVAGQARVSPRTTGFAVGGPPVWVRGSEAGASLGASLGAADLDGDGIADLILGAPGVGAAAGAGYALDGAEVLARGLQGEIDLAGFSAALGTRIDGAVAGDQLGAHGAAIGDVDGDGLVDLAFGAPGVAAGAGDEVGQVVWARGVGRGARMRTFSAWVAWGDPPQRRLGGEAAAMRASRSLAIDYASESLSLPDVGASPVQVDERLGVQLATLPTGVTRGRVAGVSWLMASYRLGVEPARVELSYTPRDVFGLDPASLRVFRTPGTDEGPWTELEVVARDIARGRIVVTLPRGTGITDFLVLAN